MSWQLGLCLLPGLVIGLTIHEFAHAWSASLLGDDFPHRNGRVSLNPLRHLSPLGTLAIFLLPMGWGKPVMVNLHNFRRPKRDYLLTSLAGPAANLLLAGLIALVMQFTRHASHLGPIAGLLAVIAHEALTFTALINIALAVVNLLPIPPLDGSKIWPCLIPGVRPGMGKRVTLVFVVLLVALAWTGSLGRIVGPAVALALRILPESDYDPEPAMWRQYDEALAAGNYGLAEDLADKLLEMRDPTPEGYYCRACARAGKDDWQGALADLNAAIALAPHAPESAKYYHWRADILDYFDRPEKAAADRVKAVALNPSLATDRPDTQPDTAPTTQDGT